MSEFFAEATVRLTPDLTGFSTSLQKKVKAAITQIEETNPPRLRIAPALTKDFIGSLRKQVDAAVVRAQSGIKPIRVPVIVEGVTKGAVAAAATAPAGGIVAPGARAPRAPAAAPVVNEEVAARSKLTALINANSAAEAAYVRISEADISVEERKRRIKEAVGQSEAAVLKTTEAAIAFQHIQNDDLAEAFAATQRYAEGLQTQAAASRDALTAELERSRAMAEGAARTADISELNQRLAATLTEVNALEADSGATGRSVAEAKERVAAATKNAAAASKAHRDALRLEDEALIKTAASLEEKAAAELAEERNTLAAARANEKAAAARAASLVTVGKGARAASAAAAGLRGATLAASDPFIIGAAAVIAFGKALQTATHFQTSLNVFKVTAGATADQMQRVSAAAIDLGHDLTLPAVNANDAADAMTELSKAGLSVQDSIDAARGTLQLATAAQLDNATAVNITASALNAFGLEGTQAVHVADLLAGAADAAQGGIGDMGGALSSVASVARQTGISIEDTVAMLTLLAKNGIQGAEAGTALRTALIRLIAPTDKAQKVLKDLGVQVLNAAGNVRPEVFADIANAVNKLAPAQRNMALATIFGSRAIRAQAILGREGITGLDAMREATNQQGLAAELAGARTQGFAGKLEAFKNEAATIGLEIGTVTIPVFGKLIQNITTTAQGFELLVANVNKTIGAFDRLGHTGGGQGKGPLERFIGSVERVSTLSFGDLFTQLDAAVEVLQKRPTAGNASLFETPTHAVTRLNQEIADTIENSDKLFASLQGVSEGGAGNEGPVGGLVEHFKHLKDQIIGNSDEAKKLRAEIDALIRLTVALGRKPTAVELKVFLQHGSLTQALVAAQTQANRQPIKIQGKFQSSKVFLEDPAKIAADKAAAAASSQFTSTFGANVPPGLQALITGDVFAFPNQAEDGAKQTAIVFADTLQGQLALALASPGKADDLTALRATLARRQADLDRAVAKFKARPTQKNLDLVNRATKLRDETQGQIDQIVQDQQADAKKHADAVAKAKNEADQRILDAIAGREDTAQNRILRAQATPRITDDIAAQQDLISTLEADKKRAQGIKDAKTRTSELQRITRELITARQDLANLNKQLGQAIIDSFAPKINLAEATGTLGQIRALFAAELRQLNAALAKAKPASAAALNLKLLIAQTQQASFDAINESFTLDISIAQTTNNKKKEIAARQRFIQQLIREQREVKKGTLEFKRLQALIVEQRQAIKDLKKETNKDSTSAFDILQQSSETFRNIASSLINSNLGGFGDAGDFTRDQARVLTRPQGVAPVAPAAPKAPGAANIPGDRGPKGPSARSATSADTGGGGATGGAGGVAIDRDTTQKEDAILNRLITALQENTRALTGHAPGSGEKTDPKKTGRKSGAVSENDHRWTEPSKNRARIGGHI